MPTHPPGAAPPPEVKADLDALVGFLLPRALGLLQSHGEFRPFGGFAAADGHLQVVAGDTGEGCQEPEEVIDALHEKLRNFARDQAVVASAVVMNVDVDPSYDGGESRDAVVLELEHRAGWASTFFQAYSLGAGGEVTEGKMWTCPAGPRVFPGGSRTGEQPGRIPSP